MMRNNSIDYPEGLFSSHKNVLYGLSYNLGCVHT